MNGVKGFTLVEVVVSMALVATTAVGLAGLFVVSAKATRRAQVDTVALFAAESKMAELRASTWAYDLAEAGAPVSSALLAVSPDAALTSSIDGYVDYVDGNGVIAGLGAQPSSVAVYLRRWSVRALPMDPANSRVLQVVAAPVTAPESTAAHLVSILTRVAR